MKVAVCLSGMLRDFEKYFENFKQNILEQADVDLFVHAWNFDRRNLSQENYGNHPQNMLKIWKVEQKDHS